MFMSGGQNTIPTNSFLTVSSFIQSGAEVDTQSLINMSPAGSSDLCATRYFQFNMIKHFVQLHNAKLLCVEYIISGTYYRKNDTVACKITLPLSIPLCIQNYIILWIPSETTLDINT